MMPDRPPKLSLKDRTMAWGVRIKQLVSDKVGRGIRIELGQPGSKDAPRPSLSDTPQHWQDLDRAIEGGKK